MGLYNLVTKSSSSSQISFFDKKAILGVETEDTSQRPSDGFLMTNKDSETILSEKMHLIRYRDLWNISRLSDTVQIIFNTRARKTFKEGFDIEPNFERANKGQKTQIKQWLRKCNNNNQSLKEVFQELDKDLNWSDDAYLLCLKDYGFNSDGEIVVSESREFVRLHPLSVELQMDNANRLGRFQLEKDGKSKIAYFNPHNRGHLTDKPFDEKTGKENLQAHYRVSTEQGVRYYNSSEIMHKSAFNPSLTYGYSPLFSLYQKVLVLMLQDSYIKKYYGDDKPTKGLLVFNTANKTALMKTFDEIRQKTQQNPHGVKPIVAESADGRKPVEYIDMSKTLNEMQFTAQRDEYRQQIGAMYGVSPMFQNDMSTGGGLNNEGLQITVTNEVIQDRQNLFNDSFVDFVFRENLGYEDWTVTIVPDVEQDLMAEEQMKAQELQNAKTKLELGLNGRQTQDGEIVFDSGELKLEEATEPFSPFNLGKAEQLKKAEAIDKEFAGYKDFDDCVMQNQDKGDPEAYCGAIQAKVEKENDNIKDFNKADDLDNKPEIPKEAKELDNKLSEELKDIFDDLEVQGNPTEGKLLSAIGKINKKLEKQLKKVGSSVFKGIYERVAKETNKDLGQETEITDKDKDLIEKLKSDPNYNEAFTNLSDKASQRLRDTIFTAFEKEDISIDNLVKEISEDMEATKGNLRNIVRTETGKIASGARKTQLEKTGAEYKYFHIGPNDNRTTELSKNLMEKTKNGVTWDEYINLLRTESKKFFPKWTVNEDYPLSHYQSRHTFNARRVD